MVGSVDRATGFDRLFRPTSDEVERRFQRIDVALRRGEEMPPIDVYRIGDVHFVIDGHHRVAVARALEWKTINAHVVEVLTVGRRGPGPAAGGPADQGARAGVRRAGAAAAADARADRAARGGDYGELAEMVEAWGFRYMQLRGQLMDRRQTAETWFAEEYEPAVELLRQAGLLVGGTETEAYLRLSAGALPAAAQPLLGRRDAGAAARGERRVGLPAAGPVHPRAGLTDPTSRATAPAPPVTAPAPYAE